MRSMLSNDALSPLLVVAAKSFTAPSVDFDCQLSSYSESNIFMLDRQPCDDETTGTARSIREASEMLQFAPY